MSSDPKGDQARAMIAALQTILDQLPEQADDEAAESHGGDLPETKDPTHELFVDGLDQYSLAGLFTSIRIIHNLHSNRK